MLNDVHSDHTLQLEIHNWITKTAFGLYFWDVDSFVAKLGFRYVFVCGSDLELTTTGDLPEPTWTDPLSSPNTEGKHLENTKNGLHIEASSLVYLVIHSCSIFLQVRAMFLSRGCWVPKKNWKKEGGFFITWFDKLQRLDNLPLIFQFPVYLEPGVDRYLIYWLLKAWFQIYRELEDQGWLLTTYVHPGRILQVLP